MTKDFNKPRRDEKRPSSRYTPSNQHREEQPFKPARPRLSRDAVDRAWENGANHQHADYRPRPNAPKPSFQQQGHASSDTNRPPRTSNRSGYGNPENSRRPSGSFNAGAQQRDHRPETGNRPFNRPDYRGSSFPPRPHNKPQEQRFEGQRRSFYDTSSRGPASHSDDLRREQRFEGQRRTFNETGSHGSAPRFGYQRHEQRELPGNRRAFDETEYRRFSSTSNPRYQQYGQEQDNDERRWRGPSNRAPGGEQRGPARPPYRGNEERSQETWETRPPRFQANRPTHKSFRDERGPQPFERGHRENPRFSSSRPGAPQSQRDNNHPRWQSRPTSQPGYQYQPARSHEADTQQQFSQYQKSEQFEGDYEGFDIDQDLSATSEERHVTRMPDGRVLKGSRPSQRKQARFWNTVAEDSHALLDHTSTASHSPTPTPPEVLEETPAQPSPKTRPAAKSKTVRTVKLTHSRGTGGMKSLHGSKAKALKRKSQGPVVTRPSQRGYKWPKPEE